MNAEQLSRYSIIKNTFDTIPSNGVRIVKRANYKLAQDFDIPSSLALNSSSNHNSFVAIDNASIPQISYVHSSESLVITLNNSKFTLNYRVNDKLRSYQLIAMKACGKQGHTFIFADEVTIDNTSYPNIYGPICVYNTTNNTIGSTQSDIANIPLDYPKSIYLRKSGVISPLFWSLIRDNETTINFAVGSNRQDDFKKCEYSYYGFGVENENSIVPFGYFSVAISSNWLYFDTNVDAENILFSAHIYGKTHTFTAKNKVQTLPHPSFEGMDYVFNSMTLDVSDLKFVNDVEYIDVYFEIKDKDGKSIGKASSTLTIKKVNYSPNRILHLYDTDVGAQYMQLGVYRIRLNTLLAPQLVAKANTGIDTILTMATQQLPEPQLGKGFYADFVLPPYDKNTHGGSRKFTLNLKHVVDDNAHVVYSGMLTDSTLSVRLFVPLDNNPVYPNAVAKVFLRTDKQGDVGGKGAHFIYADDAKTTVKLRPENNDISMFDAVVIQDGQKTEQMDFNGACALYYWELFYYTPMLCFQRLLQEKQFDEATKWMNYVYNPAGYIVNGEIAPWTWNCRPLEEATSWNANPLDAVDPDAVAQYDPTHYKVATFMRLLDQLIMRGDMAYRELTRDALNDAKMWYVRALELLGDEPEDYGSRQWAAPSLSVAASQTVQAAYQQELAALDRGEVPTQPRTANSLVGLFLPEYNPALTDYWKTLRLRLFNLRNNLSIDGQPLSLAIYAEPTDPKALLTSMVQASQGGSALPTGTLSLYRFPVMLERARNLVGQLTQFGAALLSMAEHDDADELTTLLLRQGMELATQSIRIQQRTVDEVDADITVLKESRRSAQNRLAKYQRLYDEDINPGEQRAMSLFDAAASQSLAGQVLSTAGGAADLAPNVFGFACGGSRWGAPLHAAASVLSLSATASQYSAEKISRSEGYRRRRQEWEIQRDNADGEVRQMDAQLAALTIRREAAQMQVEYQETQQAQTQAQLELLQRKFTNKVLYSWMRGKLSAIYYQFFDLAQSFCLMAQEALRRELTDNGVTFIRGGVWNGTTAGLMAGETLLLNLAEMEKAWLERDERALEVTRTVSLAQFYQALSSDRFSLTEKLTQLLRDGKGSAGPTGNELKLSNHQIEASVRLSDLKIFSDYPESLGRTRQLKQVSVTLPALVGPYEDIRAVLNYGGSIVMPRGCSAIALSHGVNDSGQFVLDFNDPRYLPFEGISVNDSGSLTLSFPDATDRQKALLESLSDIILHIRYTIRS
ncbi:hypothetical protein [Xenorhabdus entomophaga]|uniref:Tc toxin subunit A-related protein n=1 Tax=Xenorhabdus entomophaga TaxID=3136257 RepID=UPI0030F4648B